MFDFEHTGSGIHNDRFKHVTLQVAFQYSTVVPVSSSPVLPPPQSQQHQGVGNGSMPQQQGGGMGVAAAGAAAGVSRPQYVVQRRLRVSTIRWVDQHCICHNLCLSVRG